LKKIQRKFVNDFLAAFILSCFLIIFVGCREVGGDRKKTTEVMHVTDAQLHDVFTTLEHQLDTLHEDSMGIYTVTDAHAYKADVFWNSRDPEYIELVVYSKTDTAIWYKRDALGNS
jgi:hypothetical protein